MKPCVKCGAEDRYEKSGACRPCHSNATAKWRSENPEKHKAYATKYYEENKERLNAASLRWQKANPDRRKGSTARWYKNNPEKSRAANAKWRKNNPEKEKAKGLNWYAKNKDKKKDYCAKWQKNNLDARRVHCQNYRARKRSNGGTLSKNLSELLYARQKGRCACCKKPLGDNYHLDHIVPILLGGLNEDWNIQLLRASCNISKGAKDPIEYMQIKGFLI